jgi:hypothetical protein
MPISLENKQVDLARLARSDADYNDLAEGLESELFYHQDLIDQLQNAHPTSDEEQKNNEIELHDHQEEYEKLKKHQSTFVLSGLMQNKALRNQENALHIHILPETTREEINQINSNIDLMMKENTSSEKTFFLTVLKQHLERTEAEIKNGTFNGIDIPCTRAEEADANILFSIPYSPEFSSIHKALGEARLQISQELNSTTHPLEREMLSKLYQCVTVEIPFKINQKELHTLNDVQSFFKSSSLKLASEFETKVTSTFLYKIKEFINKLSKEFGKEPIFTQDKKNIETFKTTLNQIHTAHAPLDDTEPAPPKSDERPKM